MIFDTLQQTQPMTMNIDETRWLPILAKKRWYNLNRPLADGWRGTLDSRLAPNATFSVDDPVFWEKISPSIEIADRLLRATITHPLYVLSRSEFLELHYGGSIDMLRGSLDAILSVKKTDVFRMYTLQTLSLLSLCSSFAPCTIRHWSQQLIVDICSKQRAR